MSEERIKEIYEDQRRADAAEQARLQKAIEAALTSHAKKSPSIPPNGRISPLKAAGISVAILVAILAPVLSVTWSASERAAKLDGVCETVNDLKGEMNGVKQELRGLRETLIRIQPEIGVVRPRFVGPTVGSAAP